MPNNALITSSPDRFAKDSDFSDTPPSSKIDSVSVAPLLPTRNDVVKRAQELDVDPELALSFFKQESGGNWSSKSSPKGARGGMQVMPGTYRQMMGTEEGQDDAWNNMEAGLRYIRHGQDTLKTKDPELLAAGYHAGYGNKDLKNGVVPNTNDGLISTKEYARKVSGRVSGSGNSSELTDADFSDTPPQSALTDADFSDTPPGVNAKEWGKGAVNQQQSIDDKPLLSYLKDKGAQGFDSMLTSLDTARWALGGGDDAEIAKKLSDQMMAASKRQKTNDEKDNDRAFKAVTDAKGFGDTTIASLKALGTAITNPKATAGEVVEQASNSIPTFGAGLAGAGTGALVGLVGGLPGAIGGAIWGTKTGMAAGTAAVEGAGQIQELLGTKLQELNLAPTPENIQQIIGTKEFKSEALKQGLAKGLTIAAVDQLTMGLAGKVLGAPAKKAATKALANEGIDVATKKAAAEALTTPAGREALKNAVPGLGARAGAGVAATGLDATGEVVGDYAGSVAADGKGDFGDSLRGGVMGLGQSAVEPVVGHTLETAKQGLIAAKNVIAPVRNEPSMAAGPLQRATENAAANPDTVTVKSQDGQQATGTVAGAAPDGTMQVVTEDGEVLNFKPGENGLTIEPEAPNTPLTNALEVSADAHSQSISPINAVSQSVETDYSENANGAEHDLVEPEKPAEPVAPAPIVEQPTEVALPPKQADLATMTEPELRAQMKYIANQAKLSGGWTATFIKERKKVEKEINARTEMAKQSVEQEQTQEPALSSDENKPSDDIAGKTVVKESLADKPLPKELAGAKPRYNYGKKSFQLNFASDFDKAAYIAAQEKPSKRDADYLAHAMQSTGLSEDEVRAHGALVRDVIKTQAKEASPGTLKVAELPRTKSEVAVSPKTQAKNKPTEFVTEKGSSYVIHEDGTTTRNKAARDTPGHEGDSGAKKRTAKTIYFDSSAAGLSWAGLSGIEKADEFRVLLDKKGMAAMSSFNQRGPNAGTRGLFPTRLKFYDEPAIGRYPLELWKRRDVASPSGKGMYEAYAGVHAGNKIVELKSAEGESKNVPNTNEPASNTEKVEQKTNAGQTKGADAQSSTEKKEVSKSENKSKNKVFTDDAANAARERLKKRLSGQLNSGVDPELMRDGIILAGYHIEKGARTFAEYAKVMIEDLGEAVKPYLKQFYMAVKFDPRTTEIKGMSSAADVEGFDLKTLEENDVVQPAERSVESDSQNTEDESRTVQDLSEALIQLSRMGYERQTVPKLQAANKLKKLVTQLDESQITSEQFEEEARNLAQSMDLVKNTKQANAMTAERKRGVDIVRIKLLQGRDRRYLDSGLVDFALWAMDRNPDIASDLGVSVSTPKNGNISGDYNPANRIIRVFKGTSTTSTAVHEILHHTERMMNAEQQAAIRKEWAAALAKTIKKATPEQAKALEQIPLSMAGNKAAHEVLVDAIQGGPLNYKDHYQLVNPSEFWAVNATRLMKQRFDAKDSVWQSIKTWMQEFIEKAKGFFGLRSDSPVLKGLQEVMGSNGGFQSKQMLGDAETKANRAKIANDITAPLPKTIMIDGKYRSTVNSEGKQLASTEQDVRNFWNWFGDSKVVDADGRPLVVYHGTTADILQFESGFLGNTTGAASAKQGYFFTNNPETANSYTYASGTSTIDLFPEMKKEFDRLNEKILANKNEMKIFGFGSKNQDREQYLSFSSENERLSNQIKELENKSGKNFRDQLNKRLEKDDLSGSAREDIELQLARGPNPNGAVVYPSYLKIDNANIKDFHGERYRDQAYNDILLSSKIEGKSGVILLNTYDAAKLFGDQKANIYIVFDHKQIKSATGNNGNFDSTNPSIVQDIAQPNKSPLELEEQGFFRKLQANLQNNQNRVLQVQEQIAKLAGKPIEELADYYGAETNRPGRIAARLEDAKTKLTGPLMEKLAKAGYKHEQLGELLHAMHAEERNEAIAKINPDMPDSGSGMSTADANAILAKYKGDAGLHRLADDARNIAKATLDMKLAYGLIDKTTHDSLASIYKNYVPLKGDGEYGPKVKRATGHGARDEQILENISRDYDQAVVAGEKNLARQSLLALVLQNKDEAFWTVGVPPKGRYVAGKTYDVIRLKNGSRAAQFTSESQVMAFLEAKGAESVNYEVRDSNGERVQAFVKPLQDSEVPVYVEGRLVRIQIKGDEQLARQLRPLDQAKMHVILEGMRHMLRYLSKIYTAYNPAFIIRNTLRDASTGTINMLGNEGGLIALKAWTKYPGAIKTLGQWAATGKFPAGKYGKMLQEYRDHGGKTGASHMSDLEDQGKTLKQMYEDAYGATGFLKDGKAGKAALVAGRKIVGGMAHVVEVANQATENALRLSLYMAMRESGSTAGQAAQAAKTVTVNFDRKGTATPALGAIYLFFNPAVQGTANALRTLTKGKHKGQAWTALGALAALGVYAASQGQDDDKDRWLGENWGTRSKNLILSIGSNRIQIPLSQEFAPFYAFGVALSEAMRGESPMAAAGHVVSSFIDAYFPLNGAYEYDSDNHGMDAISSAIPTVIKPEFEAAVNRNSFGSQITPENEFTKNRPDNLKMNRTTKGTVYDSTAQGIAGIGESLGARKYENDISKVSPETLKHYWRAYTGGLGAFVTDSIGLGKVAGDGVDVGDVPIAKDFVKTNSTKAVRGRFYDLSKEAKSASEEFKQAKKAGDADAMDKILDMPNADVLLSMDKMIKKTTKTAGQMRDEAVDINADSTLSQAEKRLKLKELDKEEELLYRDAIDSFK